MPGVSLGPVRWSVGLDDHVTCVAVHPDGSHVAAGSLGGDAVIVDALDGQVTAKLVAHPMGVLAAAWSPDGSVLATGGQDGVVRLSTADGGVVAEHTLGGWVERLAWSPHGVLAAAAGRVLHLVRADGTHVHAYPQVSSTVSAICWAGNGTRAGVASYGGLTWFDTDRLPNDAPARVHGFKGSPLALVLSPTGKWACAGYQDASIHLWPLWSGDELTMSGYPAKIEHLAFRHDGRWLASACLEELTVWSFAGKGPKGTRPAAGTAHDGRITWVGWQPGRDVLATGGQDGRLVLWPSPASVDHPLEPIDVVDGDDVDGDGDEVATAAWTPDARGLVVGRHDGSVEFRPVA